MGQGKGERIGAATLKMFQQRFGKALLLAESCQESDIRVLGEASFPPTLTPPARR